MRKYFRHLVGTWALFGHPPNFMGAHGGYTPVAPTAIKGWVTKTFLSHLEIQECFKRLSCARRALPCGWRPPMGGRRPPAREASVPAPQGPRKVGARSAPGFLVIETLKTWNFWNLWKLSKMSELSKLSKLSKPSKLSKRSMKTFKTLRNWKLWKTWKLWKP